MSEVKKLSKYRVVTAKDAEMFEHRMNALADEGYTFKCMNVSDHEDTPFLIGVMVIGESDYSNVVSLRDVAPELVDDAIAGGFEIVSSSLSTKFVRMVRRKKIGVNI